MFENRLSRNTLYYGMALVLVAVSAFTFHIENELKTYQDVVLEDEAIIKTDEALVGEYRDTIGDLRSEIEDQEEEITLLNRQKTELLKEIKFFDYTLHTVDLMRINTFLEPGDEGIITLAASMTEEGIYNFVKGDIGYNQKSESNLKASDILEKGEGNCVEKAVLLASLLRAKGYPAGSVYVVLGTINFAGLPGEPPENHAWVEVEQDGVWRVLDTTPYLGDYSFSEWTKDGFYSYHKADGYFIYNDKTSHLVDKSG